MQVDKGGIVVYDLHVTQQHIRDGFAIGAYSPQGSRFKLLLFQQDRDGEWGQLAQASSNLALPSSNHLAVLSCQHLYHQAFIYMFAPVFEDVTQALPAMHPWLALLDVKLVSMQPQNQTRTA